MKPQLITTHKNIVISRYFKNGKWDGKTWILLTTIAIRLSDKRILFIPKGFVTDFGSLPRIVRGFLDRMGKSIVAFVVHDWLYSKLHLVFGGAYKCFDNMPQRDCDSILYDLGIDANESWCDCQAINKGLAIGGWSCYKKSEPIIEEISESTLRYIAECNDCKFVKK